MHWTPNATSFPCLSSHMLLALALAQLECLDLGRLKMLAVWHDNKGMGAAWHLEKIAVKNTASGVSTEFPCNMWLSKSDGDKQLRRELTPQQ